MYVCTLPSQYFVEATFAAVTVGSFLGMSVPALHI